MSQDYFAEKVAVITGGASGIGRAIAEILIARGAQVVIADIQEDALAQSAAEIGAIGIKTDVGNADSVQALADAAQSHFGKVDIVCNNAGVASLGLIADLKPIDWQWIINVNLFGVIHGVRSFLPLLKANPDGGFIMNTASVAGFMTMPAYGPYAVSKFGVVALTETLAAELAAEGSKVGAGILIPGPVQSNIAHSSRNRPDDLGPSGFIDISLDEVSEDLGDVPWIAAEEAGKVAVAALETRPLYVTTHPAFFAQTGARFDAIRQACFPA